MSLFFSSIANIKPVKVHQTMLLNFVNQILTLSICQVMILKTCRMYNVFGSGASHAIYAQFMVQSALANRDRKVCLIQGAGTQMALWFYAMMHLICLQQPLKATIHQSAKGAVQDIKDTNFWKCTYILLCAVFPALRALWYCDSNTPFMDKLFYLSHRTTVAIENSHDDLNDKSLFGSLKTYQYQNLIEEGNIVLTSITASIMMKMK